MGLDAILLLAALNVKRLAVLMSDKISECIFLRMGILCPSCGGTRCVYNMASGNFSEAFAYNPFIFLVVIYAAIVLLLFNITYLFNIRLKVFRIMANSRAVIVIAVLYALFGILRNII